MVAKILENWAIRDVGDRPHKLFLHFFESPAEILGEDGRVVGLRTERTELDGTGNVRGTGEFTTWDVQAVYRAVGYLSEELPKLPWDAASGTVPNEGGRVVEGGEHVASTYVTGWIRRGPIGLIGHTKGDANETVANLLEDHREGGCTRRTRRARTPWWSSWRTGASRTRRGTAGTGWTRPSGRAARPRAVSA